MFIDFRLSRHRCRFPIDGSLEVSLVSEWIRLSLPIIKSRLQFIYYFLVLPYHDNYTSPIGVQVVSVDIIVGFKDLDVSIFLEKSFIL